MDDGIIGFLILIGLGIFFAPLILAIVALSRTSDLRRKLAALEARGVQYQTGGVAPDATPEAAAAPGRVWAEASQAEEKVVEAEPPPEPVIETVEPVEPAESAPPPVPPPPRAGIEE